MSDEHDIDRIEQRLDKLDERLDEFERKYAKDRGFVAGVVFAGTALVAILRFAWEHLKG